MRRSQPSKELVKDHLRGESEGKVWGQGRNSKIRKKVTGLKCNEQGWEWSEAVKRWKRKWSLSQVQSWRIRSLVFFRAKESHQRDLMTYDLGSSSQMLYSKMNWERVGMEISGLPTQIVNVDHTVSVYLRSNENNLFCND